MSIRATLITILLLASAAPAQDAAQGQAQDPAQKPAQDAVPEVPADPPLFLGVNAAGAEEWYRVRDAAVLVRVPGGPYARRPYEGAGTTADPEDVSVPTFLVDRDEVTNARFARFLNATTDGTDGLVDAAVPGLVRDAEGNWSAAPGRERHPVTAATGHGALAYATWVGGALPTPDQWMKAAGGPEGRVYPWGDEGPDATRASYARPTARGAEPVGSHPGGASPYGCLDMAGNVYERVLVPGRRTPEGGPSPVMLKGGSWLTPHPLNLRVLDLCMQPLEVAERSVGFRVVMADPEPDRPSRTAEAATPRLRLATDWDAAVAEARQRRVPIFLSLLFDTCGQCDRTREQCYRDPRFIAYANEHLVMVVGHAPGDAMDEPHPAASDGACPLYPGLTCDQHVETYRRGIAVVGGFVVSPGNFVLHPDRVDKGAGNKALLAPERALPKWGNAVERYIEVFEAARREL